MELEGEGDGTEPCGDRTELEGEWSRGGAEKREEPGRSMEDREAEMEDRGRGLLEP